MDPDLQRLCSHHGVFLRREMLALGYRSRAIDRMLKSELITRVRAGAYVYTDHWATMSELERYATTARAAARTARTDVVLSHISSLALLTNVYWDLPLVDVHLTRTDGRCGRRKAGIQQHSGLILPGDVEYDGQLERMSPTRTALEVATLVDLEHALVVTNALLHAGMTTIERLMHRSVDMQHWPGTLNHELLLRHCDPRLESVGETRTYMALYRAGFPDRYRSTRCTTATATLSPDSISCCLNSGSGSSSTAK